MKIELTESEADIIVTALNELKYIDPHEMTLLHIVRITRRINLKRIQKRKAF